MSNNKICSIWGASGQVSRSLIRYLGLEGYRIIACTRNPYKNNFIKTQANNVGSIDLEKVNIFDEENIRHIVKNSDIVINTVGILYSKGSKNTFQNIHVNFPNVLSKFCKEYKIKKLIHLSALGIEESKETKYASSKLRGEDIILNNFNNSKIIRPSLIFSVNDKFTTRFMKMLSIFPIFPMYGNNGTTKFQPIFCGDVCKGIIEILKKENNNDIYEFGGPEVLTFREIIEILLNSINKKGKRFLLPVPKSIANLQARFFELFPKPLLTVDQLKLLEYPNIITGKYMTINDLDIKFLSTLESEISNYSSLYKSGGQFA
tara:strand:- start:10 stop:963 length:954 start_codon:yes stop_codon:yes gene_type:complete